jgi:hypothetical protein
LQACRVREVGRISVCFEGDVRVRRVLRGEIGCEVVKTTIMGFANERDTVKESFSCERVRVVDLVDVAEAELALRSGVLERLGRVGVATHDVLEDFRYVVLRIVDYSWRIMRDCRVP